MNISIEGLKRSKQYNANQAFKIFVTNGKRLRMVECLNVLVDS